MTKGNSFEGTGIFCKKENAPSPAPTPDAVKKDDTFMVGAHFPKNVQRDFRTALVASGKNVKSFMAEALDDCMEKHGQPRVFEDTIPQGRPRR